MSDGESTLTKGDTHEGTVFVAGDDGFLPIDGAAPVIVVGRSLPAGSYAVIATITVTGSAPDGSQG